MSAGPPALAGARQGTEMSAGETVQDCIFCKIVRGEVPAKKVYEDDDVLAFHDIHPITPVHFMLIPKRHIASLAEATLDDAGVLGRMLALTARLATEQGSPDGFRTIVNTGRIGRQDVMHVHIHVLGGPHPLGVMIPRN
jgi:histidine triad (HIT) family protein